MDKSRLRLQFAFATVLLVCAATFYWLGSRNHAALALQQLDATKRQAAYSHLVSSFAHFCTPHPLDGFVDFCDATAALLDKFPECDASCRELQSRYLAPQPVR